MTELNWLPEKTKWREALKEASDPDSASPSTLLDLLKYKLDFIRTNSVDRLLHEPNKSSVLESLTGKPVRLAILGSCTLAQVHSAVRVAALRREIVVTIYEADYGQYWQEIIDVGSGLHRFRPDAVLFALDAHHLAAGVNSSMSRDEVNDAREEIQRRIRECWRLVRDAFECTIIHQTPLPVHPAVLGNNEHRLSGSKAAFISGLSATLRLMADEMAVDLLSLDCHVQRYGIAAWYDSGLWYRAKQEISPVAAPMYGELVGRLLGAKQGRVSKCLVLDLDNTLWGGVIGDDGIEGIVLGQGSALGEAFVAFQQYARELSRRGIILAVCSKNDEVNALEPFDKHPEMILKRSDIACFVANWSDKATNIRAIAQQLNIGLDSLVFIDDNPFERSLVRQELPMVGVPEVGDDPALFPQTIADAGYFEGLAVTQEDRERGGQYQGNRLRDALKASATDLPSYLRSLDMELSWKAFDEIGLSRAVQLINKTNQFNLTTRRYAEEDVRSIMRDNRCFGLQLRLVDRFGDNGIISIIIARMLDGLDDVLIDTWLMSCRVLGRQVEATTLNLIVERARVLGGRRLIGEYVPTAKNGMVRDHYANLGFDVVETDSTGRIRAILNLEDYNPKDTFINVREV